MSDADLDEDSGEPWMPETYEPVDTSSTNLVGGFRSVAEQNGLPWAWGIAQREMQQRCTFTGRWRAET